MRAIGTAVLILIALAVFLVWTGRISLPPAHCIGRAASPSSCSTIVVKP